MADFTFNIAKGRVAHYASLPAANDGLVMVPIMTAGIVTDAVMRDYDTLALLLAGTSDEQTTLGRKTMTAVTVTVDDTNDRVDVDVADFIWTAAMGAAISALVLCYVPDITAPVDSATIPLCKYDVIATPNGGDIQITVPIGGLFRAT